MTEESIFQVYLVISKKKFEIYLLDKQNLKNIYKQELYLENDTDLIDYSLLSSFLDKNIFKIEKLIGYFLKLKPFIEENDILETYKMLNDNEDKFCFPITEFSSSVYRSFVLKEKMLKINIVEVHLCRV